MSENPYKTLGLDTSAPAEVIKAAYKALMKRKDVHPDLGGSLSKAQKINEAYAVLSDPAKKSAIDSELKRAEPKKFHSGNINQKILVICLHCYSVNELEDERHVFLAKCGHCKLYFDKRKAFRQQQKKEESTTSENNYTEQKPHFRTSQQRTQPQKEKHPSEIAYFLYMKGMYLRAFKDYKLLGEDYPENVDYVFMSGMCLYRLKDFKDASQYFLKAVRLSEGSFKLKVWLAKSLLKENRVSQAIEILEYVTQEKPDNLNSLAILGTSYFKIGNYREAVYVLKKVVDKRPALYKSVYWLANSYYRLRQFSHARKHFLQARQIFPGNDKVLEKIQHCERHLRMRL